MSGQRQSPPFSIHSARLVRARPPSALLVLDIEVWNSAAQPRWALLPVQLPAEDGGVFAVETLRTPAGAGHATFARCLGIGGVLAWPIAAQALLRLRDAVITLWGPPPDPITVVLEFCDNPVLGGLPLAQWLAAPPEDLPDVADLSLAEASVTASRPTAGHEALRLERATHQLVTATTTLAHEEASGPLG